MRHLALVNLCVCVIRLSLALLTSITYIICTVSISYAGTKWNGDFLYWKAENPGYTAHVIGNTSEWVMVFSFLIVTLTFIKELSKGRLQIRFLNENESYEPVTFLSKEVEEK